MMMLYLSKYFTTALFYDYDHIEFMFKSELQHVEMGNFSQWKKKISNSFVKRILISKILQYRVGVWTVKVCLRVTSRFPCPLKSLPKSIIECMMTVP